MGLVDEGVTFTERFEAIEEDLDLLKRAVGTMLAGITGQPLDRASTEALVKELGYEPVSALLVQAR